MLRFHVSKDEQYYLVLLLESGLRDVGEELAEARAEGVDSVDGGQEGAQQRVALGGAQPVVEVDL